MKVLEYLPGIFFWMNCALVAGLTVLVILTIGRQNIISQILPNQNCIGLIVNTQTASQESGQEIYETANYVCMEEEATKPHLSYWEISYSLVNGEITNLCAPVQISPVNVFFLLSLFIFGFIIGPLLWVRRLANRGKKLGDNRLLQ